MQNTAVRRRQRRGAAGAVAAAMAATLGIAGPAPASPASRHDDDKVLDGGVRFYVERDSNAARQAEIWAAEGRTRDAAYMRALSRISQAVWFTSGTPAEVRRAVHATVSAAQRQHAVPVLVAYYVPGRDCSQYSAGGAPGEQAYLEWVDAFARGIGSRRAVVILEPDGLALLSSEPWCNEGGGGSTGTPEDFGRVDERFREINAALDRLARNRRTAVYVDAGHSAWQPLNDYDAGYGEPRDHLGMASRLLRGGIDKAQGFFLNVSNFRSTADLVDYGTRLSKCIAFRQANRTQACSDADIASVPEDPDALTHFVLDTSRNGQGPWVPPAGLYPDPQDWCNPPDRGLGARPTTRTGDALVDAFLWVKRPGESDGQCTRGTAGPEDPVYGAVDPPAGQWWAEYALGLAQRANPPLRLR